MKAQELRDKLAAVRDFTVLIDNKPILDVVTDITNRKVLLSSSEPRKEEKKSNAT